MSKGNRQGATHKKGNQKEHKKEQKTEKEIPVMKTIVAKNEDTEVVPQEIVPESGHAKMPLFLLVIWIVNVAFFLFYFIRYGLPDLEKWLSR